MRSKRLGPALAAAATLLALAPTAASAAPNQKARGHRHASALGCHVSIIAEPRLITVGDAAQVSGQLTCPGGNTTGQTVTVYERSAGSPVFKSVGTPVTGPGGFYTLVPPAVTTNSLFYARAAGARSAEKAIKVAPQVTLVGPEETKQLLTGKKNHVTFTGVVTPADEGATVVLQREDSASTEEWHRIGLGVVGAGGKYTIVHTFVVPGDANIRVVVRPRPGILVRGISNTLSYDISQAENPNLTLNSSADPIQFGQSVTLTGTLKGGANTKVTLQSHTHGVPGFTKVEETTTNGSGEYTFTQMPPKNTFYRVTGGGRTSSVLFEGVKYVLTASVTATTVQSGLSLVFSGTVTPGHLGHAVYLERANAVGGGFHVVDSGAVSSTSTYSIPHTMVGSGKQIYRLKVPGDPENQGVSSSPFTIEVTPAHPIALHPITPNLPHEGQL